MIQVTPSKLALLAQVSFALLRFRSATVARWAFLWSTTTWLAGNRNTSAKSGKVSSLDPHPTQHRSFRSLHVMRHFRFRDHHLRIDRHHADRSGGHLQSPQDVQVFQHQLHYRRRDPIQLYAGNREDPPVAYGPSDTDRSRNVIAIIGYSRQFAGQWPDLSYRR